MAENIYEMAKITPSDEFAAEPPLTSLRARVFSWLLHTIGKQKDYGCPQHQRLDEDQSSSQHHDLKTVVKMGDFDMLKNTGTNTLLRMLSSDIKQGISTVRRDTSLLEADNTEATDVTVMSLAERRRIYGENETRAWDKRQAAAEAWGPVASMAWINVSLVALGLIADFSLRSPDERTIDWAISLIVLTIIAVMLFCQVLMSQRMACQIHTLHREIEGPTIKVVRNGLMQNIYKQEIVVGDVLLLQTGAVVPCDGVFLSGHGVVCNESKHEGAPLVKKATIEHLIKILGCSDRMSNDYSCFMHRDDKVLEGSCRYLVTAVSDVAVINNSVLPNGRHTWWISSLLKAVVIGSAQLLVCLLRFASEVQVDTPHRTPIQKAATFLDICTSSAFLGMIVTLPQCLPLPMTMQQSARNHLLKDKVLLQVPDACESMASVTDFCLDMTGTITQDRMTVTCGLVGTGTKFSLQRKGDTDQYVVDDIPSSEIQHPIDAAFNKCLGSLLQQLLNDIFVLTSGAVQGTDPATGKIVFLGSTRETALLQFSKQLGWDDAQSVRNAACDLEVIPFSSERMASGAFVTTADGRRRLYLKGASEVLLKACTRYVVPDANKMKVRPLDSLAKTIIRHVLDSYAEQGLRTLTLCYRDFSSQDMCNETDLKDLVSDLVFVGIVCFDNPIREGVLEAIKKIQGAGIAIRVCTGDHPATASSIARKCGIFMGAAGDVVEGSAIAGWAERRDLTNLRVLARSSPENKAYVVSALRRMNRVVAFLGDGLNDQLALKAADVSFSMAISGAEVAKQASHIALLNDDLRSIVKVITWGRCLRDSRAQFHDIHNATSIAVVIITFVSAASSTMMKPALAPVQLLWIMVLIVPLTTALGLSTDQPSELWLEANTFRKLSSYTSYIFRCIAQTSVVLFLFLFKLPGHPSTENITHLSNRTRTLIFNSLAFMLVLYCSVNWTLGSGRNLRKVNRTFVLVLVIEIGVHLAIVLRGGSAFHVAPMSGLDWGCSMALSMVVVPLAFM